MKPRYVGRFAPSPSGPLHFGSLVTAMGSYLEARRHGGHWLLRMEDHDRPREVPGAATHILRSLEAFGFQWDGDTIYQSKRNSLYAAALEQLQQHQLIYACRCSRKQQRDAAQYGPLGLVYPGTCRHLDLPTTDTALRLKVSGTVDFDDPLQGHLRQDLSHDLGDFILRRRDGCYAYQLVVVVDDAEQAVTHVVRGADLLDNTPRQLYLQRCLGLPQPEYLHLPIATNAAGEKLSKQTYATAIDDANPLPALRAAWHFLGQDEPDRAIGTAPEFWAWAKTHWRRHQLPRQATKPAPGA